jgi:hypothetical protein
MKIPEDGNHKKKATYPLPSKQGRRNQAATHQLGRERKLKGSEDIELNEKKVKIGNMRRRYWLEISYLLELG